MAFDTFVDLSLTKLAPICENRRASAEKNCHFFVLLRLLEEERDRELSSLRTQLEARRREVEILRMQHHEATVQLRQVGATSGQDARRVSEGSNKVAGKLQESKDDRNSLQSLRSDPAAGSSTSIRDFARNIVKVFGKTTSNGTKKVVPVNWEEEAEAVVLEDPIPQEQTRCRPFSIASTSSAMEETLVAAAHKVAADRAQDAAADEAPADRAQDAAADEVDMEDSEQKAVSGEEGEPAAETQEPVHTTQEDGQDREQCTEPERSHQPKQSEGAPVGIQGAPHAATEGTCEAAEQEELTAEKEAEKTHDADKEGAASEALDYGESHEDDYSVNPRQPSVPTVAILRRPTGHEEESRTLDHSNSMESQQSGTGPHSPAGFMDRPGIAAVAPSRNGSFFCTNDTGPPSQRPSFSHSQRPSLLGQRPSMLGMGSGLHPSLLGQRQSVSFGSFREGSSRVSFNNEHVKESARGSMVSFAVFDEDSQGNRRSVFGAGLGPSRNSEVSQMHENHDEIDDPCGDSEAHGRKRPQPKLVGLKRKASGASCLKKSASIGPGVAEWDEDEECRPSRSSRPQLKKQLSTVSLVSFSHDADRYDNEEAEGAKGRESFNLRDRWVTPEGMTVDPRVGSLMNPPKFAPVKRVYFGGSIFAKSYIEADGTRKTKQRSIRDFLLEARPLGHPNASSNFCIDMIAMLFIVYDIAVIPLQAFEPGEALWMEVFRVCLSSFWVLDFLRQFLVGFYLDGALIMSYRRIALRYLVGWFAFDVSLIAVDWAQILLEYLHAEQAEGAFQQVEWKIVRMMRLLRFVRSLKAIRMLRVMDDRISSEVFSVAWTLGKLFSFLVVLNHLLACAWYWIGHSVAVSKPGELNWVTEYVVPSGIHAGFEYRYATAFHWSFTQFTPASIIVQPCNLYERLFAICVLVFAVGIVSTFISGISGAVMRLEAINSQRTRHFWMLRRYLKECQVPTPLAIRIHHYCDFQWAQQQKGVQEENVVLLTLLSTSLRAELKTAIFEPTLSVHPFFVLIMKLTPVTLQSVCNTAVAAISFGAGDFVFSKGQQAQHMYFAMGVKLLYIHQDDVTMEDVNSDAEICEPVIWAEWDCKGSLQACCETQLTTVNAEMFGSIMHANSFANREATTYARAYLRGLNKVDPRRLTDLYQTPSKEGLWFRLSNEYRIQRSTPQHSTASASMTGQITRLVGKTKEVTEDAASGIASKFFRSSNGSAENIDFNPME